MNALARSLMAVAFLAAPETASAHAVFGVTGFFGGLLVYLGQLAWPDYMLFPNIDTAFVDISGRVGGTGLLKATAIMLVVANIGAGLTAQVGAARLLFGMGRENVIPKVNEIHNVL